MSDPFDILGLPARFDLDAREIERAYLSRAAAVHPDANPNQGEAGDQHPMAALNDAHETLRDPERRAWALLARLGGGADGDRRDMPEGFLIEIMETRELLESALERGDREAIERGLAEARAQRDVHIQEVSGLFGRLGPAASPEALGEIRTRLNAWRYVERLIDQVSEPDR